MYQEQNSIRSCCPWGLCIVLYAYIGVYIYIYIYTYVSPHIIYIYIYIYTHVFRVICSVTLGFKEIINR